MRPCQETHRGGCCLRIERTASLPCCCDVGLRLTAKWATGSETKLTCCMHHACSWLMESKWSAANSNSEQCTSCAENDNITYFAGKTAHRTVLKCLTGTVLKLKSLHTKQWICWGFTTCRALPDNSGSRMFCILCKHYSNYPSTQARHTEHHC